jgi:methyl-accepting chemotaxis protein
MVLEFGVFINIKTHIMNFLMKLKINQRLTMVMLMVLVFMLITLLLNFRDLKTIQKSVDQLYQNRLVSLNRLIEAGRDGYQSSISISQALNKTARANPETVKGLVGFCKENIDQLNTRYDQFFELFKESGSDVNTAIDNTFRKNFADMAQLSNTIMNELESGNFDKAESIYYTDYKKAFDTMHAAINDYTDILLKESEADYNKAHSTTGQTVILSSIIFVIISILFILSSMAISRSITSPLKKAAEIANHIAAGNLNVNVEVKGNDETSYLLQSLQSMKDNLKTTISNIIEISEAMSEASIALNTRSQRMSQGATEQASAAEEISSSMEQMASNIQQNTENSTQTEKIAVQTAHGVHAGSEATESTVKSMRDIAGKINIINDIAFQTNILALNAAVEAARAGDHGRGFAIVASEVRKLAEHSKIAAEEIDRLSKTSVSIAEEAGKQLRDIVPEIERTTKLVKEITAASIEQNSGAEQINNAVQQLTQVIQENANSSELLSNDAGEMAKQSNKLKNAIAVFKIETVEKPDKPGASIRKQPARRKDISKPKAEFKRSAPTKGIDLKMDEKDDGYTKY